MRPNGYLKVEGARWEQWGAVCDGEDGWAQAACRRQPRDLELKELACLHWY